MNIDQVPDAPFEVEQYYASIYSGRTYVYEGKFDYMHWSKNRVS